MTIDLTRSRRTLPALMVDRSAFSIFSVIKQAIGKDLTRFSIPVIWNEPLSFLQRLAECLEYSSLLDQAVTLDSPVERLHYITAFVVSHLSSHLERMSKPFNPLLGETYELKSEGERYFHYVSEQVSHHPPISAFYARGKQWSLSVHVEPKIKFQGTNVVATSDDQWRLRIRRKPDLSPSNSQSSFHSCADQNETSECETNADDLTEETHVVEDEYIWNSPTVIVHNILFGTLWCEYQGQLDIKHVQSNQHALLTIKSHSWFASTATKTAELFKYNGIIYDDDQEIGAFHGDYGHCYYAVDQVKDFHEKSVQMCSAGGYRCVHLSSTNGSCPPPCNLNLTPSSRLIWYRSLTSITDEELQRRIHYYYFTPFTMALNEFVSTDILPSTDCRYRNDIRYLEEGNLDAASAEKHRLEEQQRAEARTRQDKFQPLWFKKNDNQEYEYTGEYDRRNFDHCPKLFSQTQALQ